jgi:ribosomal protein S18 acetylase RimI-like enzyme
VQIYYESVAAGGGACGYIAENQGRVVGYVCGVWEPASIRAVLFRNRWLELLRWGLVQLIRRPGLISSFIGRVMKPSNKYTASPSGYELRPIVVSPDVRGTGVAVELVTMLFADAKSRGYGSVHLFTEIDNTRAQAFYQKVGFEPTGEIYRDGKPCIHYECCVSGAF